MSIGGQFKHFGNQIAKPFKAGADKVSHGATDLADKIDKALAGVEKLTKRADVLGRRITTNAKQITKRVDKLPGQIKHDLANADDFVGDIAERVIKQIEHDLAQLVGSGLLDKAADLAEHAVPVKKAQRLSFLEFEVNLREKVHVLRRLAKHVPSDRADIIAMVHDLVDGDTVTVHFDLRAFSAVQPVSISGCRSPSRRWWTWLTPSSGTSVCRQYERLQLRDRRRAYLHTDADKPTHDSAG